MGRLDGKVALITGTGGGIGRASALLFAREGATVVGCDLDPARAQETVVQVRTAGGTMTSTALVDLAEEDAVRAWIDDAAATHGGVDILFNLAGLTGFAPLAEDVAACALFLASDEAGYVTGANLVVDGGWSVMLPGDWTAARREDGRE